MAKFDESKVINALHPEKAEVGKKYRFADSLLRLRQRVEEDSIDFISTLTQINTNGFHVFRINEGSWEFLYPYEEPPKQRMTCRQLAEWLAKGNGEYTDSSNIVISYLTYTYLVENGDKEVAGGVKIRTWDSEKWIEPTVDVYERDCKGIMNCIKEE